MDRRWLLGGLLIAGGIGLARAATRRPKIAPGTRLLVIGDSMAVGLDPHLRQLAEEAGIAGYASRGIVGTTIGGWADSAWLETTLPAFQPTLILISLGTNDEASAPGAADRERPALEQLVHRLESSGAALVWIGPPSLPLPRQGVSDMIRAALPYYYPSEQLDIPRGPDGLHPTAAGYAGWAGALWSWLS